MKPRPKKKPVKRSSIVRKLDAEFSRYIRNRYAKNEIAECFTCGRKDYWKKLQCGHFMSRRFYSTRWNETNCQVQCYACNITRYGEQFTFGLKLDKQLKGSAEEMQKLSRIITKFSNADLNEKYYYYKKLNKTFGL